MNLVRRRAWPRAIVAGLLVAASMPPWGWWPLSFLGIAMYSSLEYAADTTRRRFSTGFAFGIGWFLPAMSWMWFLTAPGFPIAVALFASLHGLAATITRGRADRFSAITGPVLHTLVEVVRMIFPFGGVPLATLGIAQVAGPLHRIASLGGVIALTWVTWQIGTLLARAPREHRRDNRQVRSTRRRAALVVVAVWLVSFPAMSRTEDTGRTLSVAAVQGGGPQGTRAIDTDPRDVVERHLATTATITADDLDLVVWPENVIDVADFDRSLEIGEIARESARLGVPFAVGVTEDVDEERFTNAQVIVDESASVLDRYDKVRRVPFGEYMPMRGLLRSLGAPVDQVPRDAVAGTTPAVLDLRTDVGDERAAVVISWEVFFGGRAREGVALGAGFIINPTNGSSYTWTVLQSQQVASSRLRAIETGRWVVQVAPTGFSAFVSPTGDVFARTGVSERAVISRDIAVRTGDTVYVRLGDKPWIVALAVVLLGVLRARRRPLRRA
ncbi:MAG: apolipoprotein N-acyltransferase [Ilumatobacteraceae bacterium]|nr:apolipoprotein N-acyltransferase [Ilumatobacteraceae bacterium]